MTKQELKFAFRHFLEERGMWESYVMAYNVDNGYWECGTYTGNVDAFLSRVEPLIGFTMRSYGAIPVLIVLYGVG